MLDDEEKARQIQDWDENWTFDPEEFQKIAQLLANRDTKIDNKTDISDDSSDGSSDQSTDEEIFV